MTENNHRDPYWIEKRIRQLCPPEEAYLYHVDCHKALMTLAREVTIRYTELALEIGLEEAAKKIDMELKLADQRISALWSESREQD